MRPETNKPWRKGLRQTKTTKHERRAMRAVERRRRQAERVFTRPLLTIVEA